MQDEFGVQIEIENDGTVKIASIDKDASDAAINMIRSLTEEPEIGKIYNGKVTKLTDYGAFVEIFAGREGLLHVSELDDGYVRKVDDILKEGDEVVVKLIEIDKFGRLNLSRKAAMSDADKLHSPQPRKSLRLPKGKRN
jgi:polyribonucleotide nucleotidyltransferase